MNINLNLNPSDKQIAWAFSILGCLLLSVGVFAAHGAGWGLGVAGFLAIIFGEAYDVEYVKND